MKPRLERDRLLVYHRKNEVNDKSDEKNDRPQISRGKALQQMQNVKNKILNQQDSAWQNVGFLPGIFLFVPIIQI